MELIIEQLKGFCDCINEMSEEEWERNVSELIQLISNMTCWNTGEQPCETFLSSERVEKIPVSCIDKCRCNGTFVDIVPYFTPFSPETLELYLVKIVGIQEEVVNIQKDDFAFLPSLGIIRIDLRNYMSCPPCGCPPDWMLQMEYIAGYNELPDCLLQLFCDLLHVVQMKNKCDCATCKKCTGYPEEAEIVFEEGDVVSPQLQAYWNILIENGYKDTLGSISLCGRGQSTECGWGFVV